MKDKWILVNDAMPDPWKRVMVYVEHKVYAKEVVYVRDITVGKYNGEKWITQDCIGCRVIAWMDLPTIPERMVTDV